MAIDKIVAEYRLELDGLRQDVNNLKGQLKSVDDSVNTSANNTKGKLDDIGNQISGKLTDSFKKLGGAIVAAFAVESIGAFISSSIQLAAEVDGIKKAFDALNSPVLLSQLRAAVGGTVNDLELMKVALKANNFKIPLQDLAKMLQYAKQQSDLTGRSVQELSDIIIDSIGRGATGGLFELGVKQEEINAAVKETGSLYDGMFKVITDGLETAGEGYDSFADKQERLRTDINNLKIRIGEELLPVLNNLLQGIYNVASGFGYLFNASEKHFKAGYDGAVEFATKTKMSLDDVTASIGNYEEMLAAAVKKQEEVNDKFFATPAQKRDANTTVKVLEGGLQAYKDLAQQMSAQNKTIKIEQIGLLGQLQQEIENLTELQKKSNDPAEIKKYTVEIDKLQNRIKDLTTVNDNSNKSQKDTNKFIQENIKSIQEYNAELVKLGLAPSVTLDQALKYFEEYDALNKTEQEKEIDAVNKKYEKLLADADLYGADRAVILRAQEAELKALKDKFAQEEKDKEDKLNEERLSRQKKAAEDRLQAEEEALRKQQEKVQSYFNAISGLASGFNELSNSLSESRIAQLESELDKGLISQEQYDDKLKEIQKEQAKRDKAFRVFQAIIGTAQSIINAATSTPFNPALIALAAATGIAQTAAIVSAPLPKFKDGVIDLKGKGTETSDSNLALLSKGESVITAKATRKHKDALEAIQKDRFDEYVMQIYAKQIKDKQKDTAIGWDEYFYRQYLLQNKLINATERQGDKVIEAVREIPKRHRFQ